MSGDCRRVSCAAGNGCCAPGWTLILRARRAILLGLITGGALLSQHLRDLTTPQPMPAHSTLLIGFLGGVERWNDAHRGVRQVALRARQRSTPPVFAETFENRHLSRAVSLIVRALDQDRDGRLDATERQSARLIIFGQSLGGSTTVRLAEKLRDLEIPVLLTVQVDSVGWHDQVIPRNVRTAANFYQHGRLTIRGLNSIYAQDPSCTQIIGNFKLTYPFWFYNPQDRVNASLGRRVLGGGHAKMETDSALWTRVQDLVNTVITAAPLQK